MANQINFDRASQLYLQGERSSTCFAQVLTNRLALTQPDEYRRAVEELLRFGQTRIGQLEIAVPPTLGVSGIQEYARRNKIDFHSALLTLSIAEAINGDCKLKVDLDSGTVASVLDNSTKFTGGKAEWIEWGANMMFGRQKLNAFRHEDAYIWKQNFLSGKLNKQPLSLWVHGETSRHILLVDYVQNGRVYFKDSFKADIGYFKDLFGEAARKEGFNTWSVDLDTLLNSGKIAYTICDQNIFPYHRTLSVAESIPLDDFVPILMFLQNARSYLNTDDKRKRNKV
ncbi:MAG: hypothetical protein NZO16_00195 [Deltaproteobacteria bacterium]|nr:hypothetical protein [Deltaproteobacteria bacterium]